MDFFSDNFDSGVYKRLGSHVLKESHPLEPLKVDIKEKLQALGSIKAVLFDVYGTLLISGSGDISLAQDNKKNLSLSAILENFQLEVDEETLDKRFKEDFFKEIRKAHLLLKNSAAEYPEVEIRYIWLQLLEYWKKEQFISGDISLQQCTEIALHYELQQNPLWPMPGSKDVLMALKEKSLQLGIVSNAQFYTPLCLETLLDCDLNTLGFQEPLLSWSYRVLRGKPSPEIFRLPLEHLKLRGISPRETLYVGNDMLNDIYTASQAGCKTALFAGDKRSLRLREQDPRCSDLEPDIILTRLSQLEEIL